MPHEDDGVVQLLGNEWFSVLIDPESGSLIAVPYAQLCIVAFLSIMDGAMLRHLLQRVCNVSYKGCEKMVADPTILPEQSQDGRGFPRSVEAQRFLSVDRACGRNLMGWHQRAS